MTENEWPKRTDDCRYIYRMHPESGEMYCDPCLEGRGGEDGNLYGQRRLLAQGYRDGFFQYQCEGTAAHMIRLRPPKGHQEVKKLLTEDEWDVLRHVCRGAGSITELVRGVVARVDSLDDAESLRRAIRREVVRVAGVEGITDDQFWRAIERINEVQDTFQRRRECSRDMLMKQARLKPPNPGRPQT